MILIIVSFDKKNVLFYSSICWFPSGRTGFQLWRDRHFIIVNPKVNITELQYS
jgi:hypothetical protein